MGYTIQSLRTAIVALLRHDDTRGKFGRRFGTTFVRRNGVVVWVFRPYVGWCIIHICLCHGTVQDSHSQSVAANISCKR